MKNKTRRTSRSSALKLVKNSPITAQTVVHNATELNQIILQLMGNSDDSFCFKKKLDKRYYPVSVSQLYTDIHPLFGGTVYFTTNIELYDNCLSTRHFFSDKDFQKNSVDGKPVGRTLGDLLAEEKLMLTTPEDLEENTKLMALTREYLSQPGMMLDLHTQALAFSRFFFYNSLVPVPLGSPTSPALVLAEAEFEAQEEFELSDLTIPLVRCFSLTNKQYVFADVRDLKPHVFPGISLDKLVLPSDIKGVLSACFNSAEVFGDIFSGRHGGMVMLANGPSGVGKTLTAEVFANNTKRPLYVLEMAELGTSVGMVEESLQKIFARAARWNTVLLFDEADIFLSKRNETDLERNAIVGVFLRLLDQYKGMLFLTTNRAEVIDPAFASRITLAVNYPDLNKETRKTIWRNMLDAAKFTYEDDILNVAANAKINGRQIRNSVRLLSKLNPSLSLTKSDIETCLKFVLTPKN